MLDILACLQCTGTYLSGATLRQLNCITLALLTMSGRVTMLGLSRWTGPGGSYRTVQRFFYTVIPWATLFWVFFRHHLLQPDQEYLLAGDECVVTKSGKTTYGLGRFFSSLYDKPVPGVAFFALSLISRQQRRSYPAMVEQRVRSEAAKAAPPAQAPTKAKKGAKGTKKGKPPGRPKGRKSRDKAKVSLTPELQHIQAMIQKQLKLIGDTIAVSHLVLDGHFGTHPALQMALGCGLHLISKLRHDAALYFPYVGPYAGRGPRRRYGDKLDYARIPAQCLAQTRLENQIETRVYQARMLHHEFAQALNVVIIVKTNLKTRARAHVVLFSSDLDLGYQRLIDDYSLRFQIEFNFRDAKQHWGLEDFMNVRQTAVSNAANLALFLVNVSQALMQGWRQDNPQFGVLDLKAHYRGYKYVAETLKMLPQPPEPGLIAQIFDRVCRLGSVHHVALSLSTP
jgi:putative transposase